MSSFKKPIRLQQLADTSVWLEFSPLSQLTDSVNLGQGFPNWSPPPFVLEALTTATANQESHQYARSAGVPALAKAIANLYSPKLKRNSIF